jgi:hypothetical protein
MGLSFPNVLEEFDTVATVLARGSSDPQRLLLTLAAGSHPNDMFATFDQAADEPAFDVLFARYLLAQRMLRELWPEIEAFLIANGKFRTPTDYFFEPWITAETPWAFALRAVQRLNCQVPDQCALKQKLLSFLRVSLDWLDADPNLKARTAVDPSTAYRLSAGFANDPAARPIDSLMGAVLENRSAAYLFLAHDRSDLEGGLKQINEYLSHLNEDSIGLTALIVPSDKVCVDIPRLLQISLDKPWKLLSVPSPCDENNARRKLVQSLESNGLLYRFNFFYLREVITYFYPNNRYRTPLQDSANQRRRAEFEAFSTIRALRTLVANLGNNRAVASRRENRWKEPEGYSWAKPLISYLHDLFDADRKSVDLLANTLEVTPMPSSLRLAQTPQERVKALEQLVYDTRRKLQLIDGPIGNKDRVFLIENETFVANEWGPLFGRPDWVVQALTGQATARSDLRTHYDQLWKWASGLLTKLSTHYTWNFTLPTDSRQASLLLFAPYIPRNRHSLFTEFSLSGSPNSGIDKIIAQLNAKLQEVNKECFGKFESGEFESFLKVRSIMNSRIDYIARGMRSTVNLKDVENMISSSSTQISSLIADLQLWKINLEPLRATLWTVAKPVTTLDRWRQLGCESDAQPSRVATRTSAADRPVNRLGEID